LSFNSQHWYGRDGSSAYGSTLRDARKVGLVPSVTTIDKVIAAPQLTDWMVQQALDAALTLPRMDGESLDAFKVRALDDSRRQAREAADKGSALHDALEASIKGARIVGPFARHAVAVATVLREQFGEQPWVAERSFAHPLGFGGKCDLYAPGFVIDFKSKPRIEDGKRYAYDNHARQLAAYAVGLGLASERDFALIPVTLCNLFIGIEDAKVSVHIHTPAAAAKGWRQFRAALELWKAMNNFDPGFTRSEEAA
jgi:hypothetical protein